MPEVRKAICDWYQRRYGQTFDPETEAVVTLGAKEGLAHLLLAIVGPGDCVLSPDPCYPIHRFGVIIAGGEPVPVATRPGLDPFDEIEAALGRSPRKPKGLIVNFPHNPTSAVVEPSFFEKVVALAKRESLWVISDLAYADLVHDGRPAPSIFAVPGARELAVEFFTVSKSYSMPGWRVGFCVGNRDAGRRARDDQGLPRLRHVRADAAGGGDRALAGVRRRRGRQPRPLQAPGGAALRRARRRPAGRCRARPPRCSSGRRCPRAPPGQGAVEFAAELLEKARVAVSPGRRLRPGRRGLRPLRAGRDRRARPPGLRRDRAYLQAVTVRRTGAATRGSNCDKMLGSLGPWRADPDRRHRRGPLGPEPDPQLRQPAGQRR